ncbi:MAG: SRPBCC family protein [Bacteroidaceae bacterium]|nr:SRPBCC family protein [Bacteroidaceae bacterium]
MKRIESNIENIPYPIGKVYSKVSDLNNIAFLADRLPKDKIQEMECTEDSVTFSVAPVGKFTLQVVEREEPKCIKISAVNAPVGLTLWLQLVATGENSCKTKATAQIDANMIMAQFIEKPIKEGLDKVVLALSKIEY